MSQLGVNLSKIENILQNEMLKFKSDEIMIERTESNEFLIRENSNLEENLIKSKMLSNQYKFTFLLFEDQCNVNKE